VVSGKAISYPAVWLAVASAENGYQYDRNVVVMAQQWQRNRKRNGGIGVWQ